MLAQLDSDVITPPPKKPRIDIPEEKTIIPNKVKPQISNEVKEEKPKQTVQLPEEPEVDNDDDDIEDLKAKIMKTMSKIEQAEVD